jgi:hypothetical protein
MNNEDKFSENEKENLSIENELLRIKLTAQYGDAFHMETNADLPPEIENQFLKNIIAFEEAAGDVQFTTVYDKIGKPPFKLLSELLPEQLSEELNRITTILEENNIGVSYCDGPYADDVKYQYITEELFSHEIDLVPIFGMNWHFIYEQFHPNNKAEIEKNTHEFFQHWVNRSFDEFSDELDYNVCSAEGVEMKREVLYEKMFSFFESFERFENDAYNINEIAIDEQEDGQVFGFSEGMYKYDAVMESGEIIHFEDAYKLYQRREDNYWSIFYFVMPGFKW